MLRHYFLTSIHTLRQNPLYTALSVFGIALTFVFVCILFLMLKHAKADFIPTKYSERTWRVASIDIGQGRTRRISKEQYETWITKMRTPEMIVVTRGDAVTNVSANDKNGMFRFYCVSEDYYDVCSFKFLYGRSLNKQEISDGLPVIVIDRHVNDQLFGKNEDPTGKNIDVIGVPYRVVGVVENISMAAGNSYLYNANIWVPLNAAEQIRDRGSNMIFFTAKNKASVAEMQAEFTRVINETNTAEDARYDIPVWQKKTVAQSINPIKILTLFGSLILMLIPAVNILSLNVSKSYDRSEEIAVRKAFGAPVHTIFAQLLIENTMITLAGAVIGMCITPLAVDAIDQMMVGKMIIPLTLSLRFDLTTVMLVAIPCVLLFSFLSGSIPAWMTAKKDIVNVLKGETQ